jgi:hypothetical protein
MLMCCNAVWPQDGAKANRIKELQQRRLAVLEEMHRTATALFKNARMPYEELRGISEELLTARYEYAATKEDRLKACEDAIKEAQESIEFLRARQAAARGTVVEVLKAQDYLLEAQIAREKAEAGE